MEQRDKMLRQMRLTSKESRKEVQAIVETHHKPNKNHDDLPPDIPIPTINIDACSANTETDEQGGCVIGDDDEHP